MTQSALPAPAGPATIVRGTLADLTHTLERARDERFRLVRTIKESESRLNGVVAPPAEAIERLTSRIESLNQAVKTRFDELHRLDAAIDQRLAQLRTVEDRLASTVEQVHAAAAAATRAVDAARQQGLQQLEEATRQATQRVEQSDEPVRTRVAGFVEEMEDKARWRLEGLLADWIASQDHRLEAAVVAAVERESAELASRISRTAEGVIVAAERRATTDLQASAATFEAGAKQVVEGAARSLRRSVLDAAGKASRLTDGFRQRLHRELELCREEAEASLAQRLRAEPAARPQASEAIEERLAGLRQEIAVNAAGVAAAHGAEGEARQVAEAHTLVPLPRAIHAQVTGDLDRLAHAARQLRRTTTADASPAPVADAERAA